MPDNPAENVNDAITNGPGLDTPANIRRKKRMAIRETERALTTLTWYRDTYRAARQTELSALYDTVIVDLNMNIEMLQKGLNP